MKPKCETCDYFDGFKNLSEPPILYSADCRKRAPVVEFYTLDGEHRSRKSWPSVLSNNWCGEHPNWDSHKKANS